MANNNNDNSCASSFCSWSIVKCTDLFETAPPARYMHAVASHRNQMFLFGGTGATKDDKVWIFEFDDTQGKGAWNVLETFNNEEKPCTRWGHTMNLIGNMLIVFGGWDSSAQFNDVYFLNLDTRRWHEVAPSDIAPRYRSLHSAVTTHDGKIIIFGGAICSGGPYIYYGDTWIFDVQTEKFQELKTTGEKPFARAQHTAFLVDNYLMYIFGGCNANTLFNDMYVLNLQTAQWKKVDAKGDLPPSFSWDPTNFKVSGFKRPGVLVGDKMFFVGGPSPAKRTASDSNYVFDLETSTWSQIFPSNKQPVLGFHTLCLVSDCRKALLFGGTGPGMTSDSHTYYTDLNVTALSQPVVPPSTLLQDFAALLFQQRFSDFVFNIQDPLGQTKIIPAHKNILFARSFFFRALFDSNMKEVQEGSMTIQDVSPEIFAEILRYLYTDQANINPSNATEIIVLANRYGLERLERMCESVIFDALDEGSVCQLLMGAQSANLEQLRKLCKVFILEKFAEIRQTTQYQELPVEIRKELEFKYVSQSTSRSNPFKFKW